MNKFGEKLRKLRKEKGLSIRKLSELSGVAHSYLSQVETGKRGTPKVETLEKIATGLNVPSIDLHFLAGYIDGFELQMIKNEEYQKEEIERSITDQEHEEPIFLDYLGSNRIIIYQDKVFTKEEKAKLESIIKMFFMD